MKILNIDNIIYLIATFAVAFGIFAELTIVTEYVRNVRYYSYSLILLLISFVPFYWIFITNKINVSNVSKNVFILVCILLILFFILIVDPFSILSSQLFPTSNLILFIKLISLSFSLIYFLSLSYDKKRFVKFITSSYVLGAYYISVTGIFIFIMVNLNIINPEEWVEVTKNYKKYGEGDNVQFDSLSGLYSFPYYLSLILSGDNKAELFGLSFYRISGLSIEPGVATFLLTPAFFFALNNNANGRMPYVILIFLLLCFSVANIIILTSLYTLYLFKNLSSNLFIYFIFGNLVLFFLFFNDTFIFYFDFIISKFSGDSYNDLLHEWRIFGDNSIIFGSHLFAKRDYDIESSILIFFSISLIFIFVIFYLIYFYLKNNIDYYKIFPIIYILIHSIKTPLSFLFTYFFWYVLLLSIFLIVINPQEHDEK